MCWLNQEARVGGSRFYTICYAWRAAINCSKLELRDGFSVFMISARAHTMDLGANYRILRLGVKMTWVWADTSTRVADDTTKDFIF